MDDSVRDMIREAREEAHKALRRAVTLAGGQTALGVAIGVKQQNVSYWLSKRHPSPAEFVLPIEAATGVSRHDLRPDLYPREDEPAQPPAALPPGVAGGSSSLAEARS